MPEQQQFQVGKREVGNGAKWDLGVVRDQVLCFAQEGMYEEGNKAFLVDMMELRLYLRPPELGAWVEDGRQNGGGKNMGFPQEGCRYQRMK